MPDACPSTCIDPSTFQAVNNAGYKSVAEMQLLNTISHQKRVDAITESSLGQILNRMNSLDPTEAAAIRAVSTSHLSEKIAELTGSIAGAQQMLAKVPPINPAPA